jgi:hypothetical protein
MNTKWEELNIDEIEIIGNIYENPKLLKAQNENN